MWKRLTTIGSAALLALLAPVPPAVAGPPVGVSGRMVLDEVAEGLRRYRQEKDPGNRAEWLKKLAPTHDPRVAIALGEALDDPGGCLGGPASWLLHDYYDIGRIDPRAPGPDDAAWRWWAKNEADLRRRANELPR
jgi:hypothetical protein